MKARFVFVDLRSADHPARSVYEEKKEKLAAGGIRAGQGFAGALELTPNQERTLRAAVRSGYALIFDIEPEEKET